MSATDDLFPGEVRPGPKQGQSFPTTPPAPGSDLGGRPPSTTPPASTAPAQAPQADPLAAYGHYPSRGKADGPKPDFQPGRPEFNPYMSRWLA